MDTSKAEKLAEKMNKITNAFRDKIDNADELLLNSSDLISEADEIVGAEVETHNELTDPENLANILNLQNMIQDVKYIRSTLQETSELGKKLLHSINTELEIEPNAELLGSYAQLNNCLTENMKLYLQCYRDMSQILLNISKARNMGPKTVTNITVESDNQKEIISTADLIKQLSVSKENT